MKFDPKKFLQKTGSSLGWMDYEDMELPDGTLIKLSQNEHNGGFSINVKLKNGNEVSIEEYVSTMRWSSKEIVHVLPEDIPEKVLLKTFKNHSFELSFDVQELEKGKYKLSEIVVT